MAGGRSLSLSEEAEIQDDPKKDALEILVKNDGGFAQRIIHSNGMMYRRYSQGQFIAQRISMGNDGSTPMKLMVLLRWDLTWWVIF